MTTLQQFAWLTRRAVVRTLRQPAAAFPALLFPLILLAVVAAGLGSATDIPGFPSDSYLQFALAGAFVQAAMVGGINSGADLAVDIESGLLDRLALTPLRRWALLLGQLSGAVTLALLAGVLYLAIGLLFGVEIAAGVGGVAVILALAVVSALAFAALSALLALRTGSSEAVHGAFPLTFLLLTFSSFYLPRTLIDVDWFKALATYNPVSYLIEGVRSLYIDGWDSQALALGFGLGAAIVAIGIACASAALKGRLAHR
jgi:ABC-2 type transport system permease protein